MRDFKSELVLITTNSKHSISRLFLKSGKALIIILALLSLITSPKAFGQDYEYVIEDESSITITKSLRNHTHLSVPAEIEGLPVTAIEIGAFFFSTSTSITIPETVTEIGTRNFASPHLTRIIVNKANPYFSSEKGVLFNKDKSTLIGFPAGLAGSYRIPGHVSSIEILAFSDCEKLTEVTISNNVSTIEERTFYDCTNLTSVIIPNGITSIGKKAFYGCENLPAVSIPPSVTSIGEDCFQRCLRLENIFVDPGNPNFSSEDGILYNREGSTLLTCPSGKTGEISIPAGVSIIAIEGFQNCGILTSITLPESLTTISDGAFDSCFYLRSITIPDGVTHLGRYAFWNCGNLTEVTLSNGLTALEESTFAYCTELTQIEIPDNITGLGDNLFRNCSKLEMISLPANLATIGEQINQSCHRLASIEINPENPNFRSENGILFSGDRSTLILYPNGRFGTFAIPDGTTTIAPKAFTYSKYLTSLVIPASVTTIGTRALATDSSLIGIFFEGAPPHEDSSQFYGNATIYYLPENEGWEPTYFNRTTSPYPFTFTENAGEITITGYNGSSDQVAIPEIISNLPVTHIEDNAFSGHTLSSVALPNTLATIGDSAFASCPNLEHMDIPNSVTSIGESALSGCPNLTTAYFHGDAPLSGPDIFTDSNNVTVYHLAESTGWAPLFGERPTLTFPFTFTSNGSEITITGYTEYIAERPESRIVIPKSINDTPVAHIGDGAFSEHTFNDISLPHGIKTIGARAFSDCRYLSRLFLPNSVIDVGDEAFYKCLNLQWATIPASVQSFGFSPFQYCLNLKGIVVQSNNPNFATNENILYDKSKTRLIQWPGEYSGDITIPAGTTSIAAGAFSYLTSINKVSLPNSLHTIEDRAFEGCKRLLSIDIPDSVSSIGAGAFLGCTALNQVILSSRLTKLPTALFSGCANLQQITIPRSVEHIEDRAFENNTRLNTLYFEGNSPIINGDSTFLNVNWIRIYYYPDTTGWDDFSDFPSPLPTKWDPRIENFSTTAGPQSNQFGFDITGPPSLRITIEVSDDLSSGRWTPIYSFTTANGTTTFYDSESSLHRSRFYQLRMPR